MSLRAIRQFAKALLVLIACLGGSVDAHGWGIEGHQTICDIAWREMTRKAKETTHKILFVADLDDSYEFAQECMWVFKQLRTPAGYSATAA